jgi:hypothetical protein
MFIYQTTRRHVPANSNINACMYQRRFLFKISAYPISSSTDLGDGKPGGIALKPSDFTEFQGMFRFAFKIPAQHFRLRRVFFSLIQTMLR